MKHIRISRWVLVLVLCAVASIVMLAVYGKWQVGRIYNTASYANTRIIALAEASSHVLRLKPLLYSYVVNLNLPAKAQMEMRIREELALVGESLQRYERQLVGAEDRRMLQEDRRLLDGYAGGISNILGHSPSNISTALAELSIQKELSDKLTEALDRHVRYSVEQGVDLESLAMSTFRQVSGITGTFVFTIVGVLLVIGYAVSRRITSQVDYIHKLAHENETFRTIAENSPDMIIRYDLDCRHIYVNKAFLDNTGLCAEDALGKPVSALAWWPNNISAQEYEQHLRQVMHTGVPSSIQLYCNNPSTGQTYHTFARVVPEYNMDGRLISLMAISRDVSEIKRAERELEAREREYRTLSENSPNAIVRYDQQCRRVYVNHHYERISGLSRQAVLGTTPLELSALGEKASFFQERLQQVLDSGSQAEFDLFWPHPSGEEYWEHFRLAPEFGPQGEVVSVLTLAHDITARKHAEEQLRERELEFRTLVEHLPDAVVRYDCECRRVFVNPVYMREVGTLDGVWRPENITLEEYQAQLRQVMGSGEPVNILLEWVRVDNTPVSYDVHVVPEHGTDGTVIGTLAIGHNISKLRQAEAVLRQREQEFRALVENSPDTVTRFDRDCRRIYANPSMIQTSGLSPAELLGRTPMEFPGGGPAAAFQERIRQVIDRGQPNYFELHWRPDGGNEICTHIRLVPEFGATEHVASVLAVGRDITEIDTYRKQIHSLAFFDNLTTLPNRSLLFDRIYQAIANASRHGSQFGLMMLDLDHFKGVNDTLGHSVGDLLLREVADRLLDSVRGYDTVARLGGDEFAILLPEMRSGADLTMIARKILSAFQHPFNLAGRELFISTSIGIALYPDDSSEIDALFKYADSAMYHAKKQGRNNFQFYSQELTARASERMALESALRRARINNEFELYYQPQIDLEDGRLLGAEALLRWNHREHGMITPDRFIPIAEETGLILDIGEWALGTACRAVVEWNRAREIPVKVAVNLSTRQFIQNDLLSSVRSALMETGCKPEWLKLEITESLLLEDHQEVVTTLEALDGMGLAISIDDFGTGYSALSYLNRFPVSQIKIDRSFVQGVPENRDKAELVKAMISIAKALQLELVAEGVETPHQSHYLATHGCRIVQGYLYGRPMPQQEFEKMLVA